MIKANFNTYASYVTDSLYQWDLNQVLNVTGLNLAVTPEVHFSNAKMDRAIVRQATMTNHVVSVAIPNSLLQDPLTIRAHIGIYDGDTFKIVELVEIPVIPRKRPLDYQIEDADEEIYSFNAMENLVNNAVTSTNQKCDQAVETVNNTCNQAVETVTQTCNNAVTSTNQKCDQTLEMVDEKVEELESQVVLQKCSACVLFSNIYSDEDTADFICSSMVPLLNGEFYQNISITDVTIVGTSSTVGASRFNIGLYGTGFCLYTTDSMAVQTVAGKVVSFEFTLTK